MTEKISMANRNYPKGYDDLQKFHFDNLVDSILERNRCKTKTCQGKLKEHSKLWIFECVKCGLKYRIDKRKLPIVLRSKIDISNPSTWRTTCEECGKQAQYHERSVGGGGAYLCSCGWILEV